MKKLVLLRHGESEWNKENRFTGWTDVDLSEQGILEAKKAGQLLRKEGFTFDTVFTSYLKRAIRTLWIVLDEMDLMWLPVHRSWHLNEKHYGALQGLNKKETAKDLGEEQVLLWRRAYDIRPPALNKTDPRHPANETKYVHVPEKDLPSTECLKDVVRRLKPYWKTTITRHLKKGESLLIAAHGNSLRALCKYLDKISDADIVTLNLPTGIPLVYELDDDLHPVKHYYLGDPEDIEKAAAKVARQGKTK